jgi:glucose/arabinose dehydrogenase
MTASRITSAAAMIVAAVLGVQAMIAAGQTPQSPPSQAPPAQTPPAQPAERGAAPPGGGQGRGRGNQAAMLYTEQCSGCHGTDLSGGRAPSLFDETWVHGNDDETIARNIQNGFPQAGMVPYKDTLSDQQIWQLVAYLRTAGATMKGRPTYVPDPDGQVIKSEKQTFQMEILARDIETPWGLAFLPDGRLLVTERPGRIKIIEKGKPPVPVTGLPKVWEKQDGGMLDIEVHPQYSKTGWIYLSYSEIVPGYTPPPPPDPNAPPPPPPPAGQFGGRGRGGPPDPPTATVIVRGKINAKNEWTDQQVLFRAKPEYYTVSNAHYGSRFIFDRQGHLFYTLGEKNNMPRSQDLTDPLGKIHRVNDDGSVPKDNPFAGKADALPTIWSYGHRNPQGLAWDPVTGKLWESEHGPQGGDEVNVIEPGKNYGWGVISMGIQPGITKRSEPGMEQPIVYYTPTIAPSGIAFYTGIKYPGWKNNLFVSGLGGQQLRRLEITGTSVTKQEVVFNQFGRVHDVVQGPDELLYITLQLPGQSLSQSTPGMVARLVPVK